MDLDRESMLADFQSCTGIEDISESLAHLEEASWNLLDAIKRVIPEDTQVLSSQFPQPPPQDVSADSVICSSHAISSPTVPVRVLYLDNVLDLNLPAHETVSTLRLVLHAQTQLAPCTQDLRLDGRPLSDSDMPLSALSSDHLLTLQRRDDLLLPSHSVSTGGAVRLSPLPSTSVEASDAGGAGDLVNLTVTDLKSGRHHWLSRPASCAIGRIKVDVSSCTGISPQHQVWTGWPKNSTDETPLSECGIGEAHRLTVTSSSPPSTGAAAALSDAASETSSVEQVDASDVFTDADDCMFVTPQRPSREPLVADGNEDELAGVLHFCDQFKARYGECHPPFLTATLADAAQQACAQSLEQRRPLMIYLHHDDSVLANVFCSQLLCSESVCTFLTTNFVCWGWDITFRSNMHSFLDRLSGQFGARARELVLMELSWERLPMMLTLMKSRGSTELISVTLADISADTLMETLIYAHDVFCQKMQVETREHRERQARESVKLEQDLAYQASLLADRAKEEVRRAEREEQEKLEEEERKEQERRETAKQQEAAAREAVRKSLESTLPAEPSDQTDGISTIRFRSPDGATFSRRFLISDTLQTLVNYVAVRGFATDQYKVISSWPRLDLTSCDMTKCLEEMKLYPQETLMIQER